MNGSVWGESVFGVLIKFIGFNVDFFDVVWVVKFVNKSIVSNNNLFNSVRGV